MGNYLLLADSAYVGTTSNSCLINLVTSE